VKIDFHLREYGKNYFSELFSLSSISMLAMLTAIQVILSRFFSLETTFIKIGLGFLQVMVAGGLFGAGGGMIVGGLSDFVGAMLFPFGAYFPGYTITAAFSGFVYGLFFYKEAGMLKIVMAYVITTITVTLGANSVFQVLLYMKGNASFIVKYLGLLPGRIIQSLIMLCFQIALTEYCLNDVHILYRINRARVTGKHRQ